MAHPVFVYLLWIINLKICSIHNLHPVVRSCKSMTSLQETKSIYRVSRNSLDMLYKIVPWEKTKIYFTIEHGLKDNTFIDFKITWILQQ